MYLFDVTTSKVCTCPGCPGSCSIEMKRPSLVSCGCGDQWRTDLCTARCTYSCISVH
ncbi:hypothetical protein BJX99DRAFT_239632 [Aspergillus californicus]